MRNCPSGTGLDWCLILKPSRNYCRNLIHAGFRNGTRYKGEELHNFRTLINFSPPRRCARRSSFFFFLPISGRLSARKSATVEFHFLTGAVFLLSSTSPACFFFSILNYGALSFVFRHGIPSRSVNTSRLHVSRDEGAFIFLWY